ncbi:hypothetical protein [Chelatococcus asaccharovorans]|uniref:hypothetical protein n=1 Tax=Chelatococcus asaccharovorans TaxID=28210 RepID=UPI00224C64D1|nr:hypothetical protein [Chelatococcus asaccharovorans]CAH1672111.1 hypothetical protein CHELA17_61334 [Chelatococcus asaccharovorans]CAH1676472.1 hypothetical protein CHELA40_14286 [Chelatococcus asaccharovorans]
MSAVQILARAYGEAPNPPLIGDVAATSIAQLQAKTADYREKMSEWRAKMELAIKRLWTELPDQPEDIAAGIDALIAATDRDISKAKASIDEMKLHTKRVLARNKSIPKQEWKRMRGIAEDFISLMEEDYNIRVNFYYQYIAMRADIDPTSRGGPVYNKASDLLAHLRSSRR